VAIGAACALAVAACGDDEDTDTAATTTTEASDETTTAGEDGGEFAELCAVAEEVNQQEDVPTAEQVERYQALAPEELADSVELAGGAIIDAEGDQVALFAAFADDEVEAAINELSAFEERECGIEDQATPLGPDEPEEGAALVEVIAVDYSFEFEEPIAAGRTSFRVTNTGEEAHFLIVFKILEGTMQEALEFEGDAEEAGLVEALGESGLAAPGGVDEEFLTTDLEAGDYAMLCFVSGSDGTPHAFMGMAVPFTVS
jgi:hypothetical protein